MSRENATSNQRRTLTEFILVLTMFTSSFIFFRTPFEFYLHYIVFIIYLPIFFVKFKIPKNISFLLFFILLISSVNVLFNNLDWFSMIKVWGGAFLSFYFYYFVYLYFNKDIVKLFSYYFKFCLFLLIIGAVQLISYKLNFKFGYDYSYSLGFNKWGLVESGGLFGIKINSLLAEPAQLAIVTIPAFFVAINNVIFKENYFIKNKLFNYLIIFVYLSITSSTGYIGVLICLLILAIKRKFYNIIFGLLVSIIIIIALYQNVNEFRIRLDAAFEISNSFENDISREVANTSTFTLYDNYIVAINNFINNPLFGSGIGSHEIAFNKFSLTKKFFDLNNFANNSKDANSLFLRIMSETGIVGLVFVFYIIFSGIKSINNLNPLEFIISTSLLILILLSLLRQGNYFLNGLPLIFIMFYYNKNNIVIDE